MIGIGTSLLFGRRAGKAGPPIPQPDVYYDMSLKDNSSPTRNVMDDLSGNGHNAEIFNAAYTESSGYRSDGALVFDGVDDYAIMQNVEKVVQDAVYGSDSFFD